MPTTDPREHPSHRDFPHLRPPGSRPHHSPARRLFGRALVLVLVAAVGIGAFVGVRGLLHNFGAPGCRFVVGSMEQSLTPEQSANAATISAVAVRRALPPRAATIALTTAIQESKLRNLTYGDRDSLGLFQQRPSQGWGTADQVQDAVHASGAFYDRLIQVPGYETAPIGDMAQEVQRSGYPTAYAEHETEGRVLASVLTGQVPGAIGCRLDPPNGAGDAAALAQKLTRETGLTPRVSSGELTVAVRTPTVAWTVGAWAVAHAEADDVTAVTVGDHTWTRSREESGWTWPSAERPAATSTTVRITLAGDSG
ncbi:hypothetical protein [Segeticoccus rhizosphaerae]|uniref:hypothetical protein n=1 Tax=Segeticoccus rhizosphaerae TaxID=1104777 RepID=UPI00192E633C|nr:hypothetical protein [Ornithinicoccus soli]